MTITEHTASPIVASSSSGSRRRRHSRGTSGGGGSEAGVIGVDALMVGTAMSVGHRASPEVCVAEVEPLGEDEPGGRRGGLRAEPALLHGHDDDDGPGWVRDIGGVPGLVGL